MDVYLVRGCGEYETLVSDTFEGSATLKSIVSKLGEKLPQNEKLWGILTVKKAVEL